MEWEEERQGGSRELRCKRPSGYEAAIIVTGNELAARMWKARENRDTFALPPHEVPPDQVEDAVTRVKEEIESRLETLEDGHS
jgi:hypothetical protein